MLEMVGIDERRLNEPRYWLPTRSFVLCDELISAQQDLPPGQLAKGARLASKKETVEQVWDEFVRGNLTSHRRNSRSITDVLQTLLPGDPLPKEAAGTGFKAGQITRWSLHKSRSARDP